jgi:hypothetical protein
MPEVVTASPEKRQIAGEGWSVRADRVEMLGGGDWHAVVEVRPGLNLLVTWTGQYLRSLRVEAWTDEPEESDGVAVIESDDGSLRLAPVKLCECGNRGCGNAGVQLAKDLDGGDLRALLELLGELPWTDVAPDSSNVLHGEGLAAVAGPDPEPLPPGSYLYAPRTGAVFPLSPRRRD